MPDFPEPGNRTWGRKRSQGIEKSRLYQTSAGQISEKLTVKWGTSVWYHIGPDRVHEPIPYLERSEGDVGNL